MSSVNIIGFTTGLVIIGLFVSTKLLGADPNTSPKTYAAMAPARAATEQVASGGKLTCTVTGLSGESESFPCTLTETRPNKVQTILTFADPSPDGTFVSFINERDQSGGLTIIAATDHTGTYETAGECSVTSDGEGLCAVFEFEIKAERK